MVWTLSGNTNKKMKYRIVAILLIIQLPAIAREAGNFMDANGLKQGKWITRDTTAVNGDIMLAPLPLHRKKLLRSLLLPPLKACCIVQADVYTHHK
jgi:hypothetical protein